MPTRRQVAGPPGRERDVQVDRGPLGHQGAESIHDAVQRVTPPVEERVEVVDHDQDARSGSGLGGLGGRASAVQLRGEDRYQAGLSGFLVDPDDRADVRPVDE